MKCTRCGAVMSEHETDLPFKVGGTAIIVIRGIPVLECSNCPEYLIPDAAMVRVEEILGSRDTAAELQVVQFAA